MNCRNYQSALEDLLLDPGSPSSAAARAHLSDCPDCRKELEDLQATFTLLDTWKAPEPSPYFDQKLAVRLREEQATAPAGWLERLQMRLQLNTSHQLRPILIGAMALLLILGGGTYVGVTGLQQHPQKIQASATVDDLQILDRNDQALQQMDQLLQETGPDQATLPQS